MPKVKKNKTLISDFDYHSKLDNLRKEIPNIAHNLFPLYATCSLHLRDGKAPAYWIPQSINELEIAIYSKIDSLEERDNFDMEQAEMSSGGVFIKLSVEDERLMVDIGIQFGYYLL